MLDLLLAITIAIAPPAAPPDVDAYAYEVGDDNGDGRIDEDESGWDCHTMGNRICGPNAIPKWWDDNCANI